MTTAKPAKTRDEGQWALGSRDPLNANEVFKQEDDALNVRQRILDVYSKEGYDAITMAYGIRNMPDRPRALSEMFRVLKPGGHLVCLEFSTPPNAVWRALYNFYLKHLIPFWGGLITGDKAGFVYLSKSIKAFPNQEGLAKMMREAGFVDVTWKNYTGGIAAVHVAKKPE